MHLFAELLTKLSTKEWKDSKKRYKKILEKRKVLKKTYWPLASIPENEECNQEWRRGHSTVTRKMLEDMAATAAATRKRTST